MANRASRRQTGKQPVDRPTMLSIRHMIRRDMDGVLDVDEQSYTYALDDDSLTAHLKCRSSVGMVAENAEDSIVSFMIYDLQPRTLEIIRFAVDPLDRRMGVGSAMLAKLKAKLSHQKRNTIQTIVSDRNLVAHRFLRANGFTACVLRGYFGPAHDGYLFTYLLPGEK